MSRSSQEELVHFLSDLYSMELQALVQMRAAPGAAGDPQLAVDFETHRAETERHAELVRRRLEALGGKPSSVKNAIMKLGGKAMLLFARLQLETPGRLLAHAYSYEAMEWAAYAVLGRLAADVGDTATEEMAREIQAEERAMMDRLEHRFEAIESYSHAEVRVEDIGDHLRKHLAEAHALEKQSEELLAKASGIAGHWELSRLYERHLEETRGQMEAVEERLHALDTKPSVWQDAALALGALNWGLFFKVQKDTPAKLAVFVYAVEHLEIGAYELLRRTALRAGDHATEQLCQRVLDQERNMTERIAENLDLSVQATLDAVGAR